MNAIRKRRLIFVLIVVTCSTAAFYLIILALRQNVNFFFTPTQVVTGAVKQNQRVRIGGRVQTGSVVRGEGLKIQFVITDLTEVGHRVFVQYAGILPDLFKEGQGVVALGVLSGNNVFIADEILAKHDENYMPPHTETIRK